MSLRKRLVCVVLLLLCISTQAHAQQTVKTERLGIGGASPSPTSAITVAPATIPAKTAGQDIVYIDPSGFFRKGILAKGDLPSAVAFKDEANIFTPLQTFNGGIASTTGTFSSTLGVAGLSTFTGGFVSSAASQVNAAFSVSGLSTLTGGFVAGAPSSVNSTFAVSGLSTLTGGFLSSAPSTVNSTLTVTGLTTLAKVKTTGIYGVGDPFTIRDTSDAIAIAQFYDSGRTVLTNTGLTAAIQYQGLGTASGGRNWRMGMVGGNFLLQGGEDATLPAEPVWHNAFRATQTAGTPDGIYWGVGIKDIQPDLGYQTNFGGLTRKYLTGHFAELWAETLVAHSTMATIGGRVLVGPTTQLTSDLDASSTTITVKHNQMVPGDTVYLEANGYLEFMVIVSGPVAITTPVVVVGSTPTAAPLGDESLGDVGLGGDATTPTTTSSVTTTTTQTSAGGLGEGALGDVGLGGDSTDPVAAVTPTTPTVIGTGYQYTVTRSVDPTGANAWSAGDAVFNTGQAGNGFIDLYSVRGVRAGTEIGPTITGNVRLSSAYNDWAPRWAVGNLRGLYGYGASDVYGAAFGNAANVWVGIDATYGIRMWQGGTNQKLVIDPSGYVLIGQSGGAQANTYIDNSTISLRRGTTDWATLTSNGLQLGVPNSGFGNTLADTSGNLYIRSGTINRISLAAGNGLMRFYDPSGTSQTEIASGYVMLGSNTGTNKNIYISGSDVLMRTGTTNRLVMTPGTIQMADENGNTFFYLDNASGILMGNWYGGSGKTFLQILSTEMRFCYATVACKLVFNGSTGDITSTGSIVLSTGGNITSTGNFALTQASGLAFSTSSAAGGDAARMVSWAGGSKIYEYANILQVVGGSNSTIGASGFSSIFASIEMGVSQNVHVSGQLLIGTGSAGSHARVLPALNAFASATLGNATYRWKELYLDAPATTSASFAPLVLIGGRVQSKTNSYSGTIYLTGLSGAGCQVNVESGLILNHNCS